MRNGLGRRALVAAMLLFGLAGCEGGVTEPQTPSASSLATIPAGTAPLEFGTYRVPKSAWSVADFTVAFPEGWTVQYGHTYLKHFDSADDELGFYAVVVEEIYADACEGDTGELMEVGPTVLDLATALLRQAGSNADGPYPTTLGGYPAIEIGLTIPKHLDLNACSLGDIGLQVWYSSPADKYFVLLPGGTRVCTSSMSTVSARCS